MRLGEIGLLTNDVLALSDFYKALLETDNGSNDAVHQGAVNMSFYDPDRNVIYLRSFCDC